MHDSDGTRGSIFGALGAGVIAIASACVLLFTFVKTIKVAITGVAPTPVQGGDVWTSLANAAPYFDKHDPLSMGSILSVVLAIAFVAAAMFSYSCVTGLQEVQDSESRVRRELLDERTRERLRPR